MTYRAAFAVLLLTGCEARLGEGTMAGIAPDASPVVDARPCNGGTTAHVGPDGSCLVFVATPASYVEAMAACAAMNAHLAFLKTASLDTFAEQLVGTTNTWIGGSDRTSEGTFVWDDGDPFGFTSWNVGEPNNGGVDATYQEDCVIIAGEGVDKQWDDRPCDATEVPTSGSFAYLCQY